MAQILIVEDEALLAKSLRRALTIHGHDCAIAGSAEEGLTLLEQMPTDLVLLDIQLPGMSGLEAIKKIRQFDANISVIIATAHGTMAAAVEALRSGVADFLRKPLDTDEVLLAVDRALDSARLRQTVTYYHDIQAERADEDGFVSESAAMQSVIAVFHRLVGMKLATAADHPPVLITGETGTGKDLTARKLHFQSELSVLPFIEVNCTTLPRGLEEAELFGYEKGAFTGADRSKRGLFEAADGGTIFLNEIGDLPLETQAKLLQVIEQKSLRRVGGLRDIAVKVRIIAASNRNLKNTAAFREDLFYRLNTVTLTLPPLRERKADIIPLAHRFLTRFGRKYGHARNLTPQAEETLLHYSWPGNARELRQLMERMTFLSDSEAISDSLLGLMPSQSSTVRIKSNTEIDVTFPEEGLDIEQIEKQLLKKALDSAGGNVSSAARKLGLTREAMRYRLTKHDLE